MRRACEASAERHGASVDFRAEEIYQTYKIPEAARAGCSRHDHVGAADAIGAIGRQWFVRT